MDETRTKLICNLGMDEFFKYPGEPGTWRRTPDTRMIRNRKYYISRRLDDNNTKLLLQGGERVELIGKEQGK